VEPCCKAQHDRIHSSEVQPPPALVLSGGSGREFTAGVYSHAKRLLIVMDIDRMFSDNDRDGIAEM